jgi:hypothetical protein
MALSGRSDQSTDASGGLPLCTRSRACPGNGPIAERHRPAAGRWGRNLLEGQTVLNDLSGRGVAVEVLNGIAAGEHTERSLILDLALALAQDHRRHIARKTRNGLESAARGGRKGGRPRVVDSNKRRAILARRAEGQSLRQIACGVGVSLAVVHGEVTAAESNPELRSWIQVPTRTRSAMVIAHSAARRCRWCAGCPRAQGPGSSGAGVRVRAPNCCGAPAVA